MGGGRLRERVYMEVRLCFKSIIYQILKFIKKNNLFRAEIILRLLFCFKDTKKYRLINIKLFETMEINF